MSKPLPKTEDIHNGVKKVIITIHDVKLETKETVAMVTVAVDVMLNEKIERLNAIMPLNDSKDFQRVIKAMVVQVVDLKNMEKKNNLELPEPIKNKAR